jgi:hypothetical protein
MMMPIGLTIFSAVYTSWFVCGSCGFVETWIERKEDLARICESRFVRRPGIDR